jgi:hypothetical protein
MTEFYKMYINRGRGEEAEKQKCGKKERERGKVPR